jgi:hypothetical protein
VSLNGRDRALASFFPSVVLPAPIGPIKTMQGITLALQCET